MIESFFVGLLVIVWLKALLGYAEFDLWKYYKHGKEYSNSYNKWQENKP